jgi:hypothetical protein
MTIAHIDEIDDDPPGEAFSVAIHPSDESDWRYDD